MDGERTRTAPTSPLSPAAQEFVGRLIGARTLHETRVGHALARAVASHLISPAECDLIAALADQRWHELNGRYEPSASWDAIDQGEADQVPVGDLPWTPHGILNRLPQQRPGEPDERDARTLQMPVRDRD